MKTFEECLLEVKSRGSEIDRNPYPFKSFEECLTRVQHDNSRREEFLNKKGDKRRRKLRNISKRIYKKHREYILWVTLIFMSIFLIDFSYDVFHTDNSSMEYVSKIVYTNKDDLNRKHFDSLYDRPYYFDEESIHKEAISDGRLLFGYDYDYVEKVVMAEAGSASLKCQLMVAQCIRNTAKARNMTPEDVVKEIVDQYGNTAYTSPYKGTASASVKEACNRIFVQEENVMPNDVTIFYSTRGGFYSSWHEQFKFYQQVDGVKFFHR